MNTFTYQAILPKQTTKLTVFAFCAKAKDILQFAQIDRIGREEDGTLRGFQRPQVSRHIDEIRSYLSKDDAVLPNSVVVAFTSGVTIQNNNNEKTANITIANDESTRGFVVDGQQRLSALEGLPEKDFEVFVSGILCPTDDELRKQFILINNTRPLPKSLIYELLPTVDGLPQRLSSRATAAALVERLNYDETSSLHGQIKQHTNPTGVIQDTVIQKIIMNSLSDGALREFTQDGDTERKYFELLSNFFQAVQSVFPDAWEGHKPRTSRLVHSAGIIAMGFVMEYIYGLTRSTLTESFTPFLEKLEGECAWTDGDWQFGEGYKRPWNSLQFIPKDYLELSQHLLRIIKKQQPNP